MHTDDGMIVRNCVGDPGIYGPFCSLNSGVSWEWVIRGMGVWGWVARWMEGWIEIMWMKFGMMVMMTMMTMMMARICIMYYVPMYYVLCTIDVCMYVCMYPCLLIFG